MWPSALGNGTSASSSSSGAAEAFFFDWFNHLFELLQLLFIKLRILNCWNQYQNQTQLLPPLALWLGVLFITRERSTNLKFTALFRITVSLLLPPPMSSPHLTSSSPIRIALTPIGFTITIIQSHTPTLTLRDLPSSSSESLSLSSDSLSISYVLLRLELLLFLFQDLSDSDLPESDSPFRFGSSTSRSGISSACSSRCRNFPISSSWVV